MIQKLYPLVHAILNTDRPASKVIVTLLDRPPLPEIPPGDKLQVKGGTQAGTTTRLHKTHGGFTRLQEDYWLVILVKHDSL